MPGEQRLDPVVDVAAGLFVSGGYGPTTVRAIASAAGLSPAVIHHRFHDKVGLLAAMVEPLLSDLDALLAGAEEPVRSVDRIDLMRGYLFAILRHRDAAQVLLFDASARSTAPTERLADQHRRVVALLVGPRASIERQVRTRCAVTIAQLSAGELRGVPWHRLRKPLSEAAIDALLGADRELIHVSDSGAATLDVRTGTSATRAPNRVQDGES